jgi:sporulation protein YlmC with PRC-barrel domain
MKRHIFSIALAMGFASAAWAQAQQTTPPAGPPTSETEATAPDRAQPGQTPTQGAPRQAQDPRPSTSPAEGTAADRTPPGKTQTAQGEATGRGVQRSEIVGAAVVSSANARLGEVVDVVFDAADQPAFVVIESQGKSVAMPYAAASSMKKADKIVVDQSRLQAAPKLADGAWRDESNTRWKQESARYWQRG